MEKGVLQLGPWRELCYDRWWGRRANVRAAVLGPEMIVAGPHWPAVNVRMVGNGQGCGGTTEVSYVSHQAGPKDFRAFGLVKQRPAVIYRYR